MYGGFPFDPFAISYPSLGWHALVAVVGGLVFLHRLLTRGSVARVVASLALFGVFWGTWAMTQRLPPGPGDELSGVAAFVGRVDVPAFALYALAVTSVVGLCHLLLGRVVRPADLVPGRRWSLAMLVAGALWFAVLVVPAAPWAPVELGALVWTCRWCLRRLSRGSDGRTIGTDICEPIRLARLGLLPLVPAAATATYALLIHVLPNEQTLRAYVLDPIVLVQMIAGWTIVLWAVWSARRRAWPAARLSRGFRVLP